MKPSRILILSLTLTLPLFFSFCVHEKQGTTDPPAKKNNETQNAPKVYRFASPVASQSFTCGDPVPVVLVNANDSIVADSIVVFLDGKRSGVIDPGASEITVGSDGISPGTKRVRITAYLPGSRTESSSVPVRFRSDIIPVKYTYKVLGTFPHDIRAYTQGFEYHDGYFIEGTGQYGESSLRKIVPGTGDIIKSRNLSPDLFGEGITLLNGKIYQITYRNKVGFIYNAETFEQEQKFYYQNLEGWGLSNNGREIIMSDGTNTIYFLDPQYFSIIRKIEVYDNVSEVDSLNELEYIDGVLYANRYLRNEIVMIDPESGKLTGIVDMRGLLKPEDRHSRVDVLNGIAWDAEQKRLFLTGKYWPKVFRVEFRPL